MKIASLLLAVLLALVGCSTPPAQLEAQASAMGYGAPPPANWQEVVKDFVGARLRDPDSAVYHFGEPRPGWVTKAPISGGGIDATGYLVSIEVNAKNGYGGYTGFTEWRFLLRDGQVIRHATRTGDFLFWQ